ncbi:MAG: DUF6114 domain-containing protein [Candidatus Micrarchaeaceae archaeon]
MDKLKFAMILFAVSGILVIVNATMSYYTISYLESNIQKPNVSALLNQSTIAEIKSLGPTLSGLSIVGVAAGAVLLAVAYMLFKKPQGARTFAIVGIIFSLVSLAGNGGFIIGMIIGIIAGIMALIK